LIWLEKAFETRSGGMLWIALFPYFRNLHAHHRFRQIARRIGVAMPQGQTFDAR
jgi:hypothetical protein